MTDRDTANARYRQGLCVSCGQVPYSAGRPRCNECHGDYIRTRWETTDG